MSNFWRFVLAVAVIALGSGCGQEQPEPSSDGKSTAPLRVVATTTMVVDVVKAVGGGNVEVTGMMGPGVDPHLFKPTASDITELQNADIIFYSGLHLEGRMAELFSKLSDRGKPAFAVTSAIPKSDLLSPAEFEGNPDPHVWGDAGLWKKTIDPVVEALSKASPQHAETFKENGEKYALILTELDAWAKARSAELPEGQRILVTSHDAFNYLGRAYGFQVIGVQGISTVTEAGLADVSRVVDFIRDRNVKAIFVESSVPRATIERISRDSGAKVGGELFSDAMGTPGEMETAGGETYDVGTYPGMLKHNINTAVGSLK